MSDKVNIVGRVVNCAECTTFRDLLNLDEETDSEVFIRDGQSNTNPCRK